ncbi:MAG: response regulator transcription factor [Clostridiales bacterium]|jgi:two-component system LytT family response regulator|nr:response regulator transcription factor [Clostridiales bacterium]OPZ68157.1 MAG: Transcriptional regulatory protein YpdB [Firmicutes bacterium ADurb.Bin467]
MDTTIRILIADDEPGMLVVMRKLIERAEGYELAGEAADGEELLELYERESPDVVLMDVEMPKISGIDCARAIQDKNPKTVLVFATGHEQYMKSAFEVYAFDYLVKPFRIERALNTLRLIRERLRETCEGNVQISRPRPKDAPARLMLKNRDGLSFVDIDDILLIQREDRQTVIYAGNEQRFATGEGLSELIERLPANMFFRTHKSYIVNVNQIESITPYGRWTYIVRLRGTKRDALITHERFDELQKLFV